MSGPAGAIIWTGVLLASLLIGVHISVLLLNGLRPLMIRVTPRAALRMFWLALLIPALGVGVSFAVSLLGAQAHVRNEGASFPSLHCPETQWHCDLLLGIGDSESWVYLGLAVLAVMLLGHRFRDLVLRRQRVIVGSTELDPLVGEKLNRVRSELADECGVSLPPVVVVAETAARSFVQGYLRQRIVLSRALIAGLSAPRLRALLLHEVAHGRRYDNLQAMALEAVQRLCLFPRMFRRLLGLWRLDRELDCDNRAVAWTHAPLDLASALVQVSRISRRFGRELDAVEAGLVSGDAAVLEARVQNLVQHASHGEEGCPDLARARAGLLGGQNAFVAAASLFTAIVAAWAASPVVLLEVHCWVEAAIHGVASLLVQSP